MALNTKTFTGLVQDWVAAAQGASSALLDFTIGSILRAIAQAQAGVALWLQGLILRALAASRLATASGADVDSFIADFGLSKLPAVAASGTATFARFTPSAQAVVPIGALVQTADGSQTFSVYVDTSNPAYSITLGGYVIAANTASVNVPVQAITAGAGGNIAAGTLTVLQTGISGVDTANNAAAFINGIDVESDAAVRARFIAFMASLSKGTRAAIGFALTSLQQGIQYTITENATYNGTFDRGAVTVIVDDGSGAISGALVTLCNQALDLVRACGIRVTAFSATGVTITAAFTIETAAGYDHAALVAQAKATIAAFINATGLGNKIAYTKLAQVIYEASPGITDVTGLLLNGATADLVATAKQTFKAGTITVS